MESIFLVFLSLSLLSPVCVLLFLFVSPSIASMFLTHKNSMIEMRILSRTGGLSITWKKSMVSKNQRVPFVPIPPTCVMSPMEPHQQNARGCHRNTVAKGTGCRYTARQCIFLSSLQLTLIELPKPDMTTKLEWQQQQKPSPHFSPEARPSSRSAQSPHKRSWNPWLKMSLHPKGHVPEQWLEPRTS